MPPIHRRDFLNGLAWLGAASLGWPLSALAATMPTQTHTGAYPPALTGMRGSHPGAFEEAHILAFSGAREFGALAAPIEQYDLIVIGAGISGLSAAYFYREQLKRDARILILDNHDDFGGHAKRNEFSVDGQLCLSYGGTQSIEPSGYSKVALGLLQKLGINLERMHAAYDLDFFARHQLALGVFYDAAAFGKNRLLQSGIPSTHGVDYYSHYYVPGLMPARSFAANLALAPLSAAQRAILQSVLKVPPRAYAYFKGAQGKARFFGKNYVDYLKAVYQIEDPALIALLSMPLAEDSALGGRAVSLPNAVAGGLLGLPPASSFRHWLDAEEEADDEGGNSAGDAQGGAEPDDDSHDYVHHFPDGNATIARLLVRQLVPRVAKFDTPEECLTTRFDYAKLDSPDQPIRIRLNSLAVLAENAGGGTVVQYLQDGKLHQATAQHTVMAGWHMMAAHIIPSLPARQKEAMRANIKMPLVYAQVALRSWQALRESGVGAAYCPASYFQFVQMDFPVNSGAYQPPRTPDTPLVLLMIRMPCPMLGEGEVADLLRQGRADLLGTSFEIFEEKIRAQLSAMYGIYGFQAERDIAAITLNRWPHGYTYDEALYQGKPAHQQARARHGRIVIANADAAGKAYTDAAIDMAWRAVQDIKDMEGAV